MPVPFAPLVAFVLGVLLAWVSRTETSPDEPAWSGPTRAVTLYAVLVVAPVTAYFAVFATEWSFGYFLDGRHIPSALSLVLVVLAAAGPIAGFLAGRHALARHAPNELAWLASAPMAIVFVSFAALFNRFGTDATYEQFTGDFGGKPLPTSPLGFAVLWMDGIVVAGAVLTARALSAPMRPRQTPRPSDPAPPPVSTVHDDGPKRLLGRSNAPR